METKYFPDADYVKFIKEQGDNASLRDIDDHFRWVIKGEDGVEYIARPEEGRP